MAKADIKVVGISAGARPFRVAAAATRFYAGEPINFAGTNTTGAASVNTVVVLTDNKPVIGTDSFVGIAASDAPVSAAGTVVAGKVQVEVPIPNATIIRGFAKTKTNISTDSALLGLFWDYLVFDLTTAVYTIDDVAQANTGGLVCVNGNTATGELDCWVDARALRYAVS